MHIVLDWSIFGFSGEEESKDFDINLNAQDVNGMTLFVLAIHVRLRIQELLQN